MSDDLDLLVVNSMDQPIPFDTSKVLAEVDAVIQRSLDDGDPEIAFGAGATLIQAASLAGIGLAKLMYLIKANWTKYNVDMDFYDEAMRTLGKSRLTIERYVRVWEMFDSGEVPETVAPALLQRPMKDLNAIATAFASGYEFEPGAWEKLANAESGGAVLEQMREVKNLPPRKNSITIRMTRDGDLYAHNQGESFHIGWLDVGEENEAVIKAIERIVNSAGIMKE